MLAGIVLNSDHRSVVCRVSRSRVFGMWERKPPNLSKPKHYSVRAPGGTGLRTDRVLLGKYDIINK